MRGFIGRQLALHLSRQGWVVGGVDLVRWGPEEAARFGVAYVQESTVDFAGLDLVANAHGVPDAVFHLAGGPAVGPSFVDPRGDFAQNVETSANLLEWMRLRCQQAALVCVSSSAVYGAGHEGPIPEVAPLAPCSPYGFHKMVMEDLCRSYVLNFGLRIAVVRLFSVYGPGLRKQLLWDICRQLASGEAVIHLGGAGGERRDWLHVSDAVGLLSAALDLCGKKNWVVNGGTGLGTSVRNVATLIAGAWGHAAGFFFSGISRPGDPHTMIADTSRAAALGFSSSVGLAAGIAEYVEWAKREHFGR